MLHWLTKLIQSGKGKQERPEQIVETVRKERSNSSACGRDFLELFDGDDTFITRQFLCGDYQCCVAFIDGMVNYEYISRDVILPLTSKEPSAGADIKQWIEQTGAPINDLTYLKDTEAMLDAITGGDTVLFVSGMDGAYGFNTKGFQTRAILEPELEKVTRGPHDGFTENIMANMSMIRRRLKTSDLKIIFKRMGSRTNTKVCVCYLESLVNNRVLGELNRRLDQIDMDGVLASNYIEESISDSKMSIFRTVGSTERPDVAVSKLLEGRVAIMVDNTPTVLTVPFLFVEYFHTAQDYFEQFYTGTVGRLLRISGFLLTVIVPAAYVALVTLHQQMIPSGLLVAIKAARQQVPLPTVVEVLLLLFAFDILRESGERLPTYLGQSLSIVGGLVIGQAAVQARLISAPVVIVVAFTGICGLIIFKLNTPALLLRVLFIVLANFYGLYGVAFGIAGLLLHLLGIQSYGVPYLQGIVPIDLQDAKDMAIRAPWWKMQRSPRKVSIQNRTRQREAGQEDE